MYLTVDMLHLGFIYGVPKIPGDNVVLDVVATNKLTYETGLLKLAINVTEPASSERVTRLIKSRLSRAHLNYLFIFS